MAIPLGAANWKPLAPAREGSKISGTHGASPVAPSLSPLGATRTTLLLPDPPTKTLPFASRVKEKKFGVITSPVRMISDTSTGKVWAHALPATASSAAIRRAAKILVVLLV